MTQGGIQREQQVGIVHLTATAEVVIYLDEPVPLQFLDGPSHRTARDAAGFGDGLAAGVAAVLFVVTAQQVTVDCEWYGWKPVRKDFFRQHDKGFPLHVDVLLSL